MEIGVIVCHQKLILSKHTHEFSRDRGMTTLFFGVMVDDSAGIVKKKRFSLEKYRNNGLDGMRYCSLLKMLLP